MPDYHESYLGKLRALVDKERLIAPGARAIIQDDEKRVLLVQRRDNGTVILK